ncbi:unnamed protein product [Phytomonas sp. EM1]|nr:unnamed protein product [Phytomonas sp. EM1]|eukprot:CCW64200.1 unnamed protein product [Phytomonas sp. isolate EM1]
MGTSKSKEATEYYEKVFTSLDHPTEDDFTVHLALFSKEISYGIELEAVARPIVMKLVAHGVQNRCLSWLLRYCGKIMAPIVASSSVANETQLTCLRLTGLILRRVHALTRGRSMALLELISDDRTELDSSSELWVQGSSDVQKLCDLLLDYVTYVKLDVSTVITHAEVVSLLLSMCSSSLHHTTRFEKTHVDVFVEMILSYRQLEALVGVLLVRIIEWDKCPEQMKLQLYKADQKTNFEKLFSWLTGARKDVDSMNSEHSKDVVSPMVQDNCSYWELTFRHLAQLLSLLVIYQRGNKVNPVVEYIKTLKDGELVIFAALLEAISKRLASCSFLCALLYVLLHDHHSLLPDVLASDHTQVVRVIQSLQHLGYAVCTQEDSHEVPNTPLASVGSSRDDCFGVDIAKHALNSNTLACMMRAMTQFSYPFISFMTATLLLMLSQDLVVSQQVLSAFSRQSLPLRRTSSQELSVGASCLIVMCVGIIKALKDRNEQLATIYASGMNNIAIHVRDIDSYTSQRLLNLIVVILKKLQLFEREYQQATKGPCDKNPDIGLKDDVIQQNFSPYSGMQFGRDIQLPMSRSTEEIQHDAQLFLSLLDIVVDAFEVMLLRDLSRNNECLIYELLYHRDEIINLGSYNDEGANLKANASEFLENSGYFIPHVKKSLSGLLKCIFSYEAEIARTTNTSRRSEIINIIRRYNQEQSSSQLSQEPFSEDVRGGPLMSGSLLDIKSWMKSENKSTLMENSLVNPNLARKRTCELAYMYEENPNSYDFFAPFVWSTMLNDARLPGGILWCTSIRELPLFLCQSN